MLCFRCSCKTLRKLLALHRALFSKGSTSPLFSVKSTRNCNTTVVCHPLPWRWQNFPVFRPSFPRVKHQWTGRLWEPLVLDHSRISLEAFLIRDSTLLQAAACTDNIESASNHEAQPSCISSFESTGPQQDEQHTTCQVTATAKIPYMQDIQAHCRHGKKFKLHYCRGTVRWPWASCYRSAPFCIFRQICCWHCHAFCAVAQETTIVFGRLSFQVQTLHQPLPISFQRDKPGM